MRNSRLAATLRHLSYCISSGVCRELRNRQLCSGYICEAYTVDKLWFEVLG